jgi:GNAT superfamily N-acetyltransferase
VTIEIRPVDPADETAVQAFYDVYVACGRHDARSFIASPYAELAEVIRRPTEDFAYTGFLAYDGQEAVGEGWYAAFRRANLDKAYVTPRVLPAHRRRGVGSALLQHMEQYARSDGRTTLQTSPRWAMTYGPEGTGAPTVEFARKHGYGLKLVEAKRRLALPVAAGLLDELEGRVDPAYSIRAFAGPVPADLVQGWAELEASLPAEAPSGDLEIDEFPASVDAVRDAERVLVESGQVKFSAVALAPSGEAVGYTDIVVRVAGSDDPAEQWGTLVRRAHRGHGLGYGLKAAVLRLLQEQRPDVTSTITSNALSNAAMIAVNDRIGYEVVEYLGDVQKHL